MFSSSVGIALAVLLSANLPVRGDIVHQALPDAVAAPVLQALPPPPETVVRETYYGKITIDHRAHLGRRSPCMSCHGPGRVTKIEFTPKIAHERCVGCHKEQALGPVKCTGCHVKPPAPRDLPEGMQVRGSIGEADAADGAAPAVNAGAESGAATAATGGATDSSPLASANAVAPPRARPPAPPKSFARVLQLGWSGGAGTGPAVRMSSRQGGFAVTHSFDRVSGSDETRTLGLLGLGVARPIRGKWRFEAVALGGFDLVDEPRVDWMPALGARAGLEWSARQWMFHNVQLSVTGVVDLSRKVPGRDIGTVFATLSTGVALPPR